MKLLFDSLKGWVKESQKKHISKVIATKQQQSLIVKFTHPSFILELIIYDIQPLLLQYYYLFLFKPRNVERLLVKMCQLWKKMQSDWGWVMKRLSVMIVMNFRSIT